jgi:hypothetical protein
VVATLGDEYVVALLGASQNSQRLAIIGGEVLLTAHAALLSTDVDGAAVEVYRVPLQLDQLGNPQGVMVRERNHDRITGPNARPLPP